MSAVSRLATTIVFLFAVLLAGCTTIDSHKPPPDDWPITQVNEYHVPFAVVSDVCQCYAPLFFLSYGCTLFYLNQGIAEIWVTKNPSEETLGHERKHALGYDHEGSDYLEDMLQSWKSGEKSSNTCQMPERMDDYRKLTFTTTHHPKSASKE